MNPANGEPLVARISEQTVARRIVMRQETWNRLAELAEALRQTRGVSVNPEDVATIALEAGLEEIRKGLTGSSKRSGSGSRRRSRSVRRRFKLKAGEKEHLESWLADSRSIRARQRTIALWLGRNRKQIRLEALRELAVSYDGYDVANFAQNMKKDGQFFKEQRDDDGARIGWRLSREGASEAKALDALALTGV
jgi:hypothetical protein